MPPEPFEIEGVLTANLSDVESRTFVSSMQRLAGHLMIENAKCAHDRLERIIITIAD
jgi:hypothetical protein